MIIFIFSMLAACFAKELNPFHEYFCVLCQPEQLHISFGEKTNDIVVTWSTIQSTNESRVQYGETDNNFDVEVNGTSTLFVDGGPLARRQYIHTVTLKDLKFSTKYVYHAGSVYGWSDRFSFRTPPQGEDFPVRAAIFGDLGNTNAQSLSYLQDEAERDNFDMILHVGDFAYDLHFEDATVGDQFMRQIQPIAALVPYMTCPGNHEQAYNFSNYAARFSMPGPAPSLFYSFDLGPVHFVSISTEVYYYYEEYGMDLITNQYNWIKQDLEKANSPENRSKRPWIVMFGHRPMYCSNFKSMCDHELTRIGLNGSCPLEPFLKDYGVDLVFWAHEHAYERTFPLYNGTMYNGSEEQPYVNPGAPVHIVTGSAGCVEGQSVYEPDSYIWSAARSKEFGYTRFFAHNKTHVYLEQVSVEKAGQVIDSVWIIKDEHKPYDIK